MPADTGAMLGAHPGARGAVADVAHTDDMRAVVVMPGPPHAFAWHRSLAPQEATETHSRNVTETTPAVHTVSDIG